MILRPKPKTPDPVERLVRRADRLEPPDLLCLRQPLDYIHSLYQFLPLDLVLAVLHETGRHSLRQRRRPAHAVVWLAIAQSLFRRRSLPLVWRKLHSSSAQAEPCDSAFTKARQRLGIRPLRALFHRVARPVATPGLRGAFYGPWRLLALDGSVFELPDTPANRAFFGAARNQHGDGAFPQLRLAALCEVGSHTVIDAEYGPYATSELALGAPLLERLPPGCLVLMDRGLGCYENVARVQRRGGVVLARVKAQQRALPVEEALPDGSYRSHIYPSFNARRRAEGGIAVRVIRYLHTDPDRDGCGEESCLITTVLDWQALPAGAAVRLYPWRWEEESVLSEVKEVLLLNQQPLLRSKTPELVGQEMYGLLLGHALVRRVMAEAAQAADVAAVRLSFKRSLEVLEDWIKEKPGRGGAKGWYAGLVREVGRQELAPKKPRRYPRVKKATRSRWPNKKPGSPPPKQPTKPFHEVAQILFHEH
jgi:Insertion element 4 transposase N-terminal/Transposase DDE domain